MKMKNFGFGWMMVALSSPFAWAGGEQLPADLHCPVADLQRATESGVAPSIQLLNLVIVPRDGSMDSESFAKRHKDQYALLARQAKTLTMSDIHELIPLTLDCKTYAFVGGHGVVAAIPKPNTAARTTVLALPSEDELTQIRAELKTRISQQSLDGGFDAALRETSAQVMSQHYPADPAIRTRIDRLSETHFMIAVRFMSQNAVADLNQPFVDYVYDVRFVKGLNRPSLSGWATQQVEAALKN